MAWRSDMRDMEYDDEDMLDRMAGPDIEPPSFPPNLQFSIQEADLEKAGAEGGDVGDCMGFAAMGTVTSVHMADAGNRVELTLSQFAGEDGKFFDLANPASICFCDYELDKLGLDCDCEVGDMIHLIGEVRLESIHRSEFAEMAMLQIVQLAFEDESSESRDGE